MDWKEWIKLNKGNSDPQNTSFESSVTMRQVRFYIIKWIITEERILNRTTETPFVFLSKNSFFEALWSSINSINNKYILLSQNKNY